MLEIVVLEQCFYILHYLGNFDISYILKKNSNNTKKKVCRKKCWTFENNLFVKMKISKVINYVTSMYWCIIIPWELLHMFVN
jgi:hypothetical protein